MYLTNSARCQCVFTDLLAPAEREPGGDSLDPEAMERVLTRAATAPLTAGRRAARRTIVREAVCVREWWMRGKDKVETRQVE